MADTKADTISPPADESPTDTVEAPAVEPVCPVCGKALAVYSGDNPSKVGTGFCITCGTRRPLKG